MHQLKKLAGSSRNVGAGDEGNLALVQGLSPSFGWLFAWGTASQHVPLDPQEVKIFLRGPQANKCSAKRGSKSIPVCLVFKRAFSRDMLSRKPRKPTIREADTTHLLHVCPSPISPSGKQRLTKVEILGFGWCPPLFRHHPTFSYPCAKDHPSGSRLGLLLDS